MEGIYRPRLYTETDPLLPRSLPQHLRHSRDSSTTTTSRITYDDRGNGNGIKLGICGVPEAIDNVGSTARDFYAVERNCLSWFRLSVAIMSTGAVVLGDTSKIHNPFSKGMEMKHFYVWLVNYVERQKVIFGLLLFLLAAFVILAAFAVFCHAHAQLAVSRRPLRWSNTLLVAITFSIATSSLLVSISLMQA
ncbi:hypothetical protein COEREDRAFT_83021 [Coemansia reversa NRRL 1564]|uniref:DUF202 domain-containing protein n=1 Tax=Coemansia reversa (strain ATCC 12441 / NRRL 1564) TaxID=763665 RepID=A0A2G5B505_COERN|nr:hypothetical protein COEREDRAFT_83021 [Coemansia reversa NRRL 1564]|eukprot:PIA14072.1 hypothetical protein COEREDRAFT_83021 [Coemansia reversa NRRL 1564]